MDAVNMHDAKSRLSALVEAVESGRETEVVIARNGKPVARLVPMGYKPIRLGLAKGRFRLPDDWDADDGAIAASFNDGPWCPPEDGGA